MRIAFVNSMRSFGGGERWLVEVASGLASRGHSIVVVARPGSRLIDRAESAGHTTVTVSMRGDFDPLSIARLARELARFRADIVSVNIQRAVRVGGIAARIAGIAPVVERRGLLLPLKHDLATRATYTRLVSHVIANCRAIADSLSESGLLSDRMISVIPNGIDPARVQSRRGREVRSELGIARGAPLITVAGRLVPDKGHRDAIRAFARVLEDHPRARLLIVGGGGLRGDLEEEARRATPLGSVLFAGQRDDVGDVLGASDLLLVTSLREGMPHVILEAMAARVPVVATSVAGIPEMLKDGREGILVPPHSPEGIAAAVSRVLSDSELAARLAAEARERVRREFSLASMIDSVEECFLDQIRRVDGAGR